MSGFAFDQDPSKYSIYSMLEMFQVVISGSKYVTLH